MAKYNWKIIYCNFIIISVSDLEVKLVENFDGFGC